MSSSEMKKEASSSALGRSKRCAGCRYLNRMCVPDCVFAPLFPAPEDKDRFGAVHHVFSAANVSKLLAELKQPEERAEAVESLVYEADARLRDPTFGCVSYINILEEKLEETKGQLTAARAELEGLGGDAAALQPIDLAAAQQSGEAQLAATLRWAKERDETLRAKRQADEAKAMLAKRQAEKDAVVVRTGHGVVPRGHGRKRMAEAQQTTAAAQAAMMQQAEAAQQHRHPLVQHETGPPIHGHLRQQTVQQLADVQRQSGAADQVAREQDMMMLRQVSTSNQKSMLHYQLVPEMQQMTSAAELLARQQDMMIRQVAVAQKYRHQAERYAAMGLEQPRHNQQTALQMAEAAKLDTATEVAKEQGMMMRVMRQAAAEEKYYHDAMVQAQQLAAADEMIRQAAAVAGLTTDQYMMLMMQQDVAGEQQHHGQAEQYAAIALARDQNMTMTVAGQQHHDRAQQYANMRLNATTELGRPNLQQQTAPQQLSATAEVAREKTYAHAMRGSGSGLTITPFLPGGSANDDAFLVQQQRQLQTVNALGSQVEPSLLPLPRQQQNDGGDEGQSSDLDLAAYFSTPYPRPPSDGR